MWAEYLFTFEKEETDQRIYTDTQQAHENQVDSTQNVKLKLYFIIHGAILRDY